MKRIIFAIALLLGQLAHAQNYVVGTSYFNSNNYVEYVYGNLPVIISVPHGGTLRPASIPDRTNTSCGTTITTVEDSRTDDIARALNVSLFNLMGKRPHTIISLLSREKLDMNREIIEAACGNATAQTTWNDYHNFINTAKSRVISSYGRGLFIDLHGQGHTIQRNEIGYTISENSLRQSDAFLNQASVSNNSSIRSLTLNNLSNQTHAQLIRGAKSFGTLLANAGYPSVPSLQDPAPASGDPYFDGGYNTVRWGSRDSGLIDALQVETNYDGVRNTTTNINKFADSLARVIKSYIESHYFPSNNVIITSAGSGNWMSPSTWVGGVIPDTTDNVIIGSNDTIIVNSATPNCKDLSFADTSAHIAMLSNGVLSLYGNLTILPLQTAFSTWSTGSKLKFTGITDQSLIGWQTSTTVTTSLMEVIVDKLAGKVATSGSGANVKLGLGTSLEIINGTFELGTDDDIQGVSRAGGSSTQPSITIQANGIFNMAGGASYIRSRTNIGDDASKIGKLTVLGTANLATGNDNSRRTNFDGIDIENGGLVEFPTGRGTASATFNPGTVTIKPGGIFKNNLTTAYWFVNVTTPNGIVVAGGEFNFAGINTTLPQVFVIPAGQGGIVRYSGSGVQTMPASITTYENLILSNASLKSLGANTTVNGYLSLRGTATFNRGGFTLTYGTNGVLHYGSAGQASSQTSTDNEWPATGNMPKKVLIYNSGNVTLHAPRSIDTLGLTNGRVILGNNDLTTNFLTGGSSNSNIVTNGTGKFTRTNVSNVATLFPVSANTGSYSPATITNNGTADNFTIHVSAATPCNVTAPESVNRVWDISETVAGGSNAELTLQWNDTLENASFNRTASAIVHCNNGTVDVTGPVAAASGTNPYTRSISGVVAFSPFGVTSSFAPVPTTYTFVGSGNWSNPANWTNNTVPPANLTGSNQIIINPATGECVLDVNQTITGSTAKLTVTTGKILRIVGDLIINQ